MTQCRRMSKGCPRSGKRIVSIIIPYGNGRPGTWQVARQGHTICTKTNPSPTRIIENGIHQIHNRVMVRSMLVTRPVVLFFIHPRIDSAPFEFLIDPV